MNLRFLGILLAFVNDASAQECVLCPGNEPPTNGNLVIGSDDVHSNLTCNDVASLALTETVENCHVMQEYGYSWVCGCPGVEAGTCPGLCPDGSAVGLPDHILEGSNITCSFFDLLAKGTSDENVCSAYQQIGKAYCECLGNPPVCSGVCPDGQPPPNLDAHILGISCRELNDFMKLVTNETECLANQHLIGAHCGCGGVAPSICSGICSNGQAPQNPNAIVFNHTSCAEYDNSVRFITDETKCVKVQEHLGIFCGCTSSILPALTSAPTDALIHAISPSPTLRFATLSPILASPIDRSKKSGAVVLGKTAFPWILSAIALLGAFV